MAVFVGIKEVVSIGSKKLAIINGRRVLVDATTRIRQDSDREYNQARNQKQSDYIKFYHSAEWLHTREQVLTRDNGMCQRCGLAATLVDHIIPSEDDWDNRLDQDNLQSLCRDCHYWKTRRETIKRKKGLTRAMTITVLAGYPGSGKSTYVTDHAGPHDLIYDYDRLMAALTGQPMHQGNIDVNDYIQLIYEMLLRKLKAEQTFANVWIVLTYPDDKLDSLLASQEVRHIMLDTSRDECIQRLNHDKRDVVQLLKVLDKIDKLKSESKFDKFKIVSNEKRKNNSNFSFR